MALTRLSDLEKEHEEEVYSCFKDRPFLAKWPSSCLLPDSDEMMKIKTTSSQITFIHGQKLYKEEYDMNRSRLNPERDDDDSVVDYESESSSSFCGGDRYALPYEVSDIEKFCEALPKCYPFDMHLKARDDEIGDDLRMCYCPVGERLMGWKNKYDLVNMTPCERKKKMGVNLLHPLAPMDSTTKS